MVVVLSSLTIGWLLYEWFGIATVNDTVHFAGLPLCRKRADQKRADINFAQREMRVIVPL